MEQEDKELLLKDLSARLPYKVNVCLYEKETCILMGIDRYEVYLDVDSDSFRIESIKPYLRPMSSMTEEERKIYIEISSHLCGETVAKTMIDWLNKNHFDYRGLIPKSLAIPVTEVNNPYKTLKHEEN